MPTEMKRGKVYFNLALMGQYSVHQIGIGITYFVSVANIALYFFSVQIETINAGIDSNNRMMTDIPVVISISAKRNVRTK